MPEGDTQILEVIFVELRQHILIDLVLGEYLFILAQSEFSEPLSYLTHTGPTVCRI